jgi:hypothetical protein
LSSPFAFELGKALISHRHVPEVIVAKALTTCIANGLPVKQIVGPQSVILSSPSSEHMRDGLAPLQIKETSHQPAFSCLDLLGEQ